MIEAIAQKTAQDPRALKVLNSTTCDCGCGCTPDPLCDCGCGCALGEPATESKQKVDVLIGRP